MRKFEDGVPSNVFIDREYDLSKKSISEMNEKLEIILRELNKKLIDDTEINKYILNLKDYKKSCGRFLYSKISDFCYESEDIDTLTGNVEKIYLNYTENDKEFKAVLLKLYDHIQLVNVQKGRNDFMEQNLLGNFNENIELQKKELIKRRNEIIELKVEINDIKKDFLNQLISLIGIFIAVAFVLFGGINSLGSLTNSINAALSNGMEISIINRPIILWGITMFNLLYLFMYFIFKLTGNSKDFNGSDYEINQWSFIRDKYGLLIIVNLILFILYFVF